MALPVVATAFTGAVSYVSGKIISDLVFKAVMWTFLIFVASIAITYTAFILGVTLTIHGLIVNVLSFIENNTSGNFMSNFYGVITCSGVLGGINASKGVILSALAFRVLKFSWINFVQLFIFLYFAFSKAVGARFS
jgi:hypothetical protein